MITFLRLADHKTPWTDAELRILRERWISKCSDESISETLDRSVEAVRCKRKELRLVVPYNKSIPTSLKPKPNVKPCKKTAAFIKNTGRDFSGVPV